MGPVIPDRDEKLEDQTQWELYVQRVGEPKRFENWKSQAVVYGVFAAVAVGTAVLLVAFLNGWPK